MAEFVFDDAPKSGFGMGDKKKGDFVFDSDTDQGDSSILRRTVGDLGVALAKGTLVGIPETVTGLLDIPTMGYAGKAAEAVGKGLGIGGFKEGREYFDEMLTPETKQAVKEVQETKGFFPTIGAALQRPSAIAQTVGESIPSMVAGGALTGMAAKGLGMGMTKIPVAMETAAQRAMKAGKLATLEDATALTAANAINKANIIKGATIGGVGEGIVTAGQNIEQTRQATPEGTLTPGQIAIQAASGILTGGISILSGRFAQYLNLADPQTMAAMIAYGGVPRTVAQKTKWTQDLSNVLKTMAREGFLEELPQSVQEAVAQNLALGKPVEEGIWEQGAMGLLSGMAQGGGAQVLSSAMDRMANDPIDQEINRGIEEIGGTEAQIAKNVPLDATVLGEETPPVVVAPAEALSVGNYVADTIDDRAGFTYMDQEGKTGFIPSDERGPQIAEREAQRRSQGPTYEKVSVKEELEKKIAAGKISMNDLAKVAQTYATADPEVSAIAQTEIDRRSKEAPEASQVFKVKVPKKIDRVEEARRKVEAKRQGVPYKPEMEEVSLTPKEYSEYKKKVEEDRIQRKAVDKEKRAKAEEEYKKENTVFAKKMQDLPEGSAIRYALESIKQYGLKAEDIPEPFVRQGKGGKNYLTKGSRQKVHGYDYTTTSQLRNVFKNLGFKVSEGVTKHGKYTIDELADELNNKGFDTPEGGGKWDATTLMTHLTGYDYTKKEKSVDEKQKEYLEAKTTQEEAARAKEQEAYDKWEKERADNLKKRAELESYLTNADPRVVADAVRSLAALDESERELEETIAASPMGDVPFSTAERPAGKPIPIQVISETKDGIMEISFKGEKPYPYRIPFAGDREKIKTLLRNRNYKAAEKKIDESMDKTYSVPKPLTDEERKKSEEALQQAKRNYRASSDAGSPLEKDIIYNAFAKLKTMPEAIDWLVKNAKTPSFREIASRIAPYMSKDGEFSVVEIGDRIELRLASLLSYSASAVWHQDAKTGKTKIIIRGKSFEKNGLSEKTILHELLHEATVARVKKGNLEANRGTELHSAVQELYALQNFIVDVIKKKRKNGTASEYEKSVDLEERVNDLDELVAYGFTDKKFQEYLQTIPYSKTESMWSQFVKLIKNILGLKDDTALDHLIRITDEILLPEAKTEQYSKGQQLALFTRAKILQSAMFRGGAYHEGPFNENYIGRGFGTSGAGWGMYVSELINVARSYAQMAYDRVTSDTLREVKLDGISEDEKNVIDAYTAHLMRDLANVKSQKEGDKTIARALSESEYLLEQAIDILDDLKIMHSGGEALEQIKNILEEPFVPRFGKKVDKLISQLEKDVTESIMASPKKRRLALIDRMPHESFKNFGGVSHWDLLNKFVKLFKDKDLTSALMTDRETLSIVEREIGGLMKKINLLGGATTENIREVLGRNITTPQPPPSQLSYFFRTPDADIVPLIKEYAEWQEAVLKDYIENLRLASIEEAIIYEARFIASRMFDTLEEIAQRKGLNDILKKVKYVHEQPKVPLAAILEVEVPDHWNWMDWDKHISDKNYNLIKNYVNEHRKLAEQDKGEGAYSKEYRTLARLLDVWFSDFIQGNMPQYAREGEEQQPLIGSYIYKSLSEWLRRSGTTNSDRDASKLLSDMGIHGNRLPVGFYSHGGRARGKYNYVVFEPSLTKELGRKSFPEEFDIVASVVGVDRRILERMSPEDRKKAEDAVAEKMDAIDPADYTYVSAELKQQLDDEKTGTEVLHGRAVSEGRRWRVGVLSGVRERLERELRNFKRFISFFHPRGTHPELLAALSEERIAYRASLLLKLEKAKTQREREGIIEGAKTIAGSSKEVKAITERLSQIEDALYGNREKGIRGLRESSPEATEKKGIIKNVNDWTALIKERAELRERKDTLIEQAEKDILKTPDVARLDARIEALDRDIAALDSKPKVFSIDEDAYKNKYARPAYALGASEGYEVVFIKDHYGFYNAFVNEGLKKIYVRVDAAHDALKLVRHEIAHIQKEETKKVMAMVDTESSAFQEYWKKWSKYSGVVGSMKAALEEYACDLRAGIEVNYRVTLKEGLLKTEEEYIGKLEDLIVRPKQVDVIAELPSYTEIPTADRANTHDNAVDLIKGHSKEPMSFSKAIGEMRTKFGRKFRLTELAELMGKRYVEVSYNAEKMTNKNAPAQYIKADNTIYLNPAVLMKLKRADDALETALSFNAVMAIAEQSETELSTRENRTALKISYGDFQMKKDLSKFKESLNPYLKDAPENVKRIYNYHVFGKGAEIKSILGLAVYPDVAGWLDSLPAPGEGKGGNSLWQRLKDIILRAFGRVSKGRTKLDELAEIMDKYLQVSGKPLKDLPNKMFEEARKYPTSEAYIKAVSYVKTDMPAVKEDGLSLDIYKNRYGKTRTEPREEDLQTAAKMGYKYAEVTDLQAEITGIEQQLKEKQSEAKRSDLEEQLMKKRERLYSTILPIQTEHQRLRQIWAQAHGKKAFGKEGVGKFAIPERKRLEEEYDEMIEAPAGLTVNTFVNRRGLGFSLVERKEQAQGPVPTKAQSDPVEALDDHYKPMAKAWVQFLLRPKSKSRGTTILSEQDYINGIFKNISKRIVEEDTYDYITSVAEAFQEIKDAVLSSVEFYKANGGTPVMAALEAIQKDVQEETSAYQQRVDQLTELFKRFRGIEDLSILEELPEEPVEAVPEKVEKVEKAEKKGTGEVIFYKGNTKIATMNMEVTGEDARISKLSGGSYLLNMFAKIFSDNPKVNTISMAVDQTTNKKERTAQLQTMASWKDLGAEENFVMGGDWVMTLDKTKFVKAITTPEEKKEIDIYTNQPKQPASVNAILDLWMRPEEILEKDQLPFGRRFTDVRKNKVAIPKIYDSYQEYLKRQTDRRLSPEEEHDAVLKAKYGDKKSIEDLVMTNQGFIHGIAKRLSKDPQEIMDLVQVGNTGFLDALQFFDPNRGFTYKTYAAIYVKSAIFKYLVENKTIRIPVGVFRGVNDEINAEIAKITGINTSGNIKPEVAAQQALDENKENLFKKVFPGKAYNIESLMPEELALLEGRFSRFYMDVYNALTQTQGQMKLDALAAVSMSKPTGEDTDIGDALADELTDTEEDKQGLKELLHKHLINAMGALSDVEQTAIYNRYIVGMTQEDVGIILNVTKNRVNQILRGIKGKSLGAHAKLLREVMRLEAAEAAQDNAREDFERNTHMSIADFFEPVNWVKVHLRKAGQAVEKNIKSQIDNNYVDHPHMMKKEDHNKFRNIITSHGGINYSKTREILSLPRQNAEKSSDWRKLWDIFVKRIRERDVLSHAWLTKAKRFIHIQSTFKAAGLTKAQAKKEKHNIGRVLTIGDENLRNIRLALIKEVNKLTSEIKKGGRLFSSDLERRLAEAQAKLDRLNTEKRYSYDEAVKEGIEDWDGTKIKLTDLGYKLYSEVRATEDEIFNAYLGHSQNMLVRQYQKQKWYEALQFALGKEISDKEILKIANKLQATSSEKDLEKINRKGIYLRYNDIFARINKKFSEAEKQTAGQEVKDIYDKISKDVAEELEEIKKLVQALGGGENIDEAVKEMFIAYQRVRPRLKRIRDVRNEWNEWPGFFPRERTAGTRKFKLYEQYVDSKGVAKEKEIFSQHFSSESEGLDIYSEVVDRYGKNGELPQKYRWDAEPIVKTEEGAFEGVKDFNVQAILDTAFENMRTEGGKFFDANGKEVDIKGKVWDTTFEAIAGQFQARGAQAHGIHRKQKPGEKAIKGYLEVDHDQILKRHITSMAGLITKQEAAYSALEAMSELKDKTRAPELREYIKGQLRNDTNLDRISTKIRTFAFMFFLGGMFKSAAVNSTQPIIVGIPELDRYIRAKSIKGVSGTMAQLRASRLVALHPEIMTEDPEEWAHKTRQDGSANPKYKRFHPDDNMDKYLHEYLSNSLINGMMLAQHLRLIKGEMSGWGGAWNKAFDVLATPFSMVEKFNRITSGIAMFEVAINNYKKDPTLDWEAVYEKATYDANEFIDRVHYAIGKHNLPIPAQSGTALGVGLKTAYTFRPFTHNFLLNQFNMLRSAARLMGRPDAEARAQATNDLKTVLHTMFLMAIFGGMMGLPFFKDLSEFYEKHFGYSPKEWLRSALRGMGGQYLETVGMSGIPGLLGADMSGSLAIGVPFMGDQDSIDSVFGVYAGLGKKVKMAGQALSRGDYYRVTANLAPEFLRSPVVALTESDFGKEAFGFRGFATTTKGMPSYSSEGKILKYEGLEIPVKMLGFQPTRMKREREVEQAVKKQVLWATEEKSNISERFRIDRLQNDKDALKTMLKSVRELNIKLRERKIPVPLANVSSIIKNSRQTKNLQKRRELARRLQLETQ